MKKIKISLFQLSIQEKSPFLNWLNTRQIILKHLIDDPGIIILPELCFYGVLSSKEELLKFYDETQKIIDEISALAKDENLTIICTIPDIKNNSQIFNTTFIFTSGDIIKAYNKINLFSPMNEDQIFEKGEEITVSPIMVNGHEITVGFLTCFDLRFPEIARQISRKGAELLIVNALWPIQRINHFTTLLRARAIENQFFAAGVNAYGRKNGYFFGGKSSVIAPDGKILILSDNKANFLTTQIDLDDINKTRQIFNTSFSNNNYGIKNKTLNIEELKKNINRRKNTGQKMVFTNGCFDILHAGHVTYLERARNFGDFLVLGLNSDESIRRLKGESRPVNNEQSRARVLEALECIDYICVFNEDTPLNLITELIPDVLVKGADWEEENIVGAKFVREHGGTVQRIAFEYDISTTRIIEKINFNKKKS